MREHEQHPSSAAHHAGPRPRLPAPAWMLAWPSGVQPVSLRANTRGVEFLYRAPGDRWFRVEASIDLRRPSALRVRGLPGPDPATLARLSKAVERCLLRSPSARAWLAGAQAWVTRLEGMQVFGAAGPSSDPLIRGVDELLGHAARVRSGEHLGPEQPEQPEQLSNIEAALAGAGQQLGASTLAQFSVALLLACGAFERALACWGRHAATIEADDSRGALACAAIMSAYRGDVANAHANAKRLAAQTRDGSDARHAGELLELLGQPQLAAPLLSVAASDAGEDASAFDVHFRLAYVAAAAHGPDQTRRAAARMLELARRPEQLLATARMQREAGEFLLAEATLAQLVRDHPHAHERTRHTATLELATSKLWRRDHEGAASLARDLLATNANDPAALRTLGVALHLGGRSPAGLELLVRALEIDPRDDEARLWRAEILDQLGDYSAARFEVNEVSIGDFPAWQLLRALVEEHHTPNRRIDHDTWFIVDTNIRALLGDEAPANTKANHQIATASITRALARLGGNRSKRLTTANAEGELRWLEIESPRHRAELLQLHACHRPIDDVVAAFEQLAAAHPAVPFFVTYPAELLMWRGEYERAFLLFEQVWYATRTRWGYVGAGAAAMLLGRDERALELWEEGKAHYLYIDAEATYCYRGELLRKRGELDQARPDLELAVQARPERLGAWVNLALLEHAAGREGPMREAVARVEALCPAFAWEARRDAQLGDPNPRPPNDLARYMSTLLELLRGNRSSVMYTIVDRNDALRVLPVVKPDVWRDFGRRSLALFEDELLAALVGAST
ncbi:Transcriptional regulator, GntR family domain / Aspartate aminotransferase [Enhygromyxa salina]|uniref:Transcriptional regulator, GntR family domain / Aspartate aminotransferase n=1 Tax=Enhygromyxa salina TaxID=215803 RepID=A0A0C2D9X6_9BACT|nr:tetratricopeptide repeat protein [Enhygromyxa salina]KIG18365.1 Transcriptional regulator, GntR family domain / Aspartate aminotransferase [Enhygromyxa salina]